MLHLCDVCFAAETRQNVGLEIHCGEVQVKITAKAEFLEARGIPFKAEHLRLGADSRLESCGPRTLSSGRLMVISVGLRDCGSQASVRGEWLVYSNRLFLFPAVLPTSTGSAIVKGETTVIPVECHYERKLMVNSQPVRPTWLPMTSTISSFGLLHFSLRTTTDDCTSQRSSSVYQQGEAVFLEASVEAPLHPPLLIYVDNCVATLKPDPLSSPSYKFITKHGCLVDSVLPGSSSKFIHRSNDNRLCFSFQAFHFNQESGEEMFINCHLTTTLKQNSHSCLYKACFFHKPTFSWRATEGDNVLCECCNSDGYLTEEEKSGHTSHTIRPDEKHEADTTVGPLHILPHPYWTGRLSINP
ncbi:zona pellucida sperm-binding protein 3-like [Echeneis naucrates]|uniref:zona pellucida sperm-binding protein 3-like n=1 Tax=Echeneis naucrates TaxID=173247 RepID=UPI001113D206|nr:zona pellucida sperm-binding protein 3-like [Echeneis naucrates]